MKLTFEPLGKYVRLVDERNTDLATEAVLGINIDKYFMPSVANVIGTDLGNYKLLRKGRFACNPMHVGRDGRLPVARYTEEAPAIVSPAYFMFEIIDKTEIEPEYLMLCFRRPDFDRMCWFRTDASVRGGITWEDVCALTIPVPPLPEQQKIVRDYQVITDRIALLRKVNEIIEAQSFSIFEEATKNSIEKKSLKEYGKVLTGKTPSTDAPEYYGNDVPFIKTPDMHDNLYVVSWESALSKLGADSQSNKYLPPDSVIVSCIGANAGEVSLTSCEAQTNQQINAVITRFPRYIYCALKKSREELRALGDAGSTMININKSLFENFQIVSVERGVLEQVEKELTPLFSTVKNNLHEMVLLNKLTSLIMSRLSIGTI